MLFSKFVRFKTNISRYILHSALVFGVVIYAICGALIIRFIETPPNNADIRSLRKRSQEVEKQNWKTLTGADIAKRVPSVDDCLLDAVKRIVSSKNCLLNDIDESQLNELDQCYISAAFSIIEDHGQLEQTVEETEATSNDVSDKWNFVDAVIFSYTVMTTIGYGHVAPVTPEGRVFCVIYGLIGIPFTLLTIADLGMFISKLLKKASSGVLRIISWLKSMKLSSSTEIKSEIQNNFVTGKRNVEEDGKTNHSNSSSKDDSSEMNERSARESVVLAITFFTYLIFGSYAFSLYEPDMDFFKAIYFNFVTLTTIGLGDLVPRREKYLFVTLLYTTVGLALTTIAMEIAANLLKKIHYFGRKIENVSNITVWFGGQKMTMKKLVRHLGDHMNVPVDELASLNLDKFVTSAIKVEAGEIKTLRKPQVVMRPYPQALRYSDIRKSGESTSLRYIDENRSCSIYENMPPLATETGRSSPGRTSIYSTISRDMIKNTGRSHEVILDFSRLSEQKFGKLEAKEVKRPRKGILRTTLPCIK